MASINIFSRDLVTRIRRYYRLRDFKKSIEKIYSNYGISNDKNSLFSSDKIRYRNETEYPSFLDLINFTK